MGNSSLRAPLGVMLKPDSEDAKLVVSKRNPAAWLQCAATYRPIRQTCRASECALHPDAGGGCYVARGRTSFHNGRLEDVAESAGATALAITRAEAALIHGFAIAQTHAPGLDLRLGVTGEVSGPRGVRSLATAAAHWRRLVGGQVWTYTHAWRRILRSTWGVISALASVDTPAEIARAKRRGYVPAITVPRHEGTAPFTLPDDPTGTRFIRCPNETFGLACVECRLCLDDGRLRERNMGIAFARSKRKLPMVR